jgi:predicted amidohydrolase
MNRIETTASVLVAVVANLLTGVCPVDGAERSDAEATTVTVAAISFVPTKLDLAGNADRLEAAFRKAKAGGARIAVAPEGALDGYVVNEIIAGKYPADRMNDVAIPIDGPMIGRFQALAIELDICLAFGFAERVKNDVFNCAVFIDSAGEICGKYHKMQLAEGYDPSWWFNRLGERSRAFDTPYGRCGLLICNDRWNPDLARLPVLDGAQFLLIPSFGSRSTKQDEAVLSRGRENGVPVVEANVGVTLIVDQDQITAVDRDEDAITFGQITIPAASNVQARKRDALERQFLEWREEEMQRRLEKTRKRLQESSSAP